MILFRIWSVDLHNYIDLYFVGSFSEIFLVSILYNFYMSCGILHFINTRVQYLINLSFYGYEKKLLTNMSYACILALHIINTYINIYLFFASNLVRYWEVTKHYRLEIRDWKGIFQKKFSKRTRIRVKEFHNWLKLQPCFLIDKDHSVRKKG